MGEYFESVHFSHIFVNFEMSISNKLNMFVLLPTMCTFISNQQQFQEHNTKKITCTKLTYHISIVQDQI